MSDNSLPTSTAGRVTLAAFWLAVLVGGGYWWKLSNEEDLRRAAQAKAQQAAERLKAQGVTVLATHPGPGGQLHVLDVVAPDPFMPSINERSRCFLWRGAGGDSLTCSRDGVPAF